MNESSNFGNSIKQIPTDISNIQKIYNYAQANPDTIITSELLVNLEILKRSSDAPFNFLVLEVNGCLRLTDSVQYSESGRPLKGYIFNDVPFSTDIKPEKISKSSARINQEEHEVDFYLNFLIFRSKRVLKFKDLEEEIEWHNVTRFIDYKWNRGTPLKDIIILDKCGIVVDKGTKITAEKLIFILIKENDHES